MKYPCQSRPAAERCDHQGPGGFMGHTCMPPRPTHVWVFSENRRVYAPGSNGPPIWREHWQKREIVGETSRSYVDGNGTKYPKLPSDRSHVYDEKRLDLLVWANKHRHQLREALWHCPADKLVEVAALFGVEVPS